jgi:hypothetical protein
MKKITMSAFISALAFTAAACGTAGADGSAGDSAQGVSPLTGNGAPSGPHYNLNVIGRSSEISGADLTDRGGHVIFVPLTGKTQIDLIEGDTFRVLDANGTDGTASFQLPNPDPTDSGTATYSVWARQVGTPGGGSMTTACARDADGYLLCSTESMVTTRTRGGRPVFKDVSRQLLYIYADVDGDGTIDRVPLFSDSLQGYFWQYDNSGAKVVQLRFYPVPSP